MPTPGFGELKLQAASLSFGRLCSASVTASGPIRSSTYDKFAPWKWSCERFGTAAVIAVEKSTEWVPLVQEER